MAEINNSFNIIVGENLRWIESSRTIFSKFYVEIDEYYFPSQTWEDFSYSILSMWIYDLISLQDGKNHVSMRFMDGDYRLDVKKKGESVLIAFVEGEYQPQKNIIVHWDYFVHQVNSAMRFLSQLLYLNSINNPMLNTVYSDSIYCIQKMEMIKRNKNDGYNFLC